MSVVQAEEGLARGYESLAAGEWSDARDGFTRALEAVESPEALDGLGRALWWLREEHAAIVNRERAYAGFRRDGDLARAARIALWLSREYALVFGNDSAAGGWLARAERLLRDVAPGAEQGWLDLARSERTRDVEEAARLAGDALAVALEAGDTDLELRALAQLGFAEVSLGQVDVGLGHLDEAMAAATSGEPATLETFADVCCVLMLACERAGDSERPQQWSRVLEDFVRRYARAAVALRMARGEPEAAIALLEGRLDEVGWTNLLAASLLDQLVEARLADDRVPEAEEAAEMLAAIAGPSGRDRVEATAALARGRVAAAAKDPNAIVLLKDAVNRFAGLGLRLEAARARLELARILSVDSPELAIDGARQARNELEALGVTREADAAAALMRSLGAKGRAGPKSVGLLTRREQDVLRLLGEGLSNRDIASRLYISPKTAEHHVGRIYGKLGVKSRAEAAAYAVRSL